MTSDTTSPLPASASLDLTGGGESGQPVGRPRRSQVVPSGVIAMLIFVFTEIMFFTGLVSAFLISRASIGPGAWPPPGQPRLPVGTTALNTVALLLSAPLLFLALRALRQGGAGAGLRLGGAMALGAGFLLGQGREWIALLHEGLTLRSSLHGSFFYIIVGCHGLHALVALLAMGWSFLRLRAGTLRPDTLAAVSVFWFFVVGVWPFLYYQIYL